jgi:hypothetical protein
MILERTLPDTINGQPVVKWSITGGALQQLLSSLAARPTGEVESYAWAGPAGFGVTGLGPDQAVIEAIYPFEDDGESLAAFEARYSESEPCNERILGGHTVATCVKGSGWFREEVTLFVKNRTMYIIHGDVEAALRELVR